MEWFVLLIVVAAGVAAYFWLRARSAAQPAQKGGDAAEPKTVANLAPGDGVSFWDGENCLVETVLHCTEHLGTRTSEWRWVFVSNDRVIEVAPDGNVLYERSEVLHQGTEPFQELTGEGGALKTFEERVREGTVGSQPVRFRHGRSSYQVRSTGTFAAVTHGQAMAQEVWRDISPEESENVYFEMEAADGGQVLGIWTTHIALLFGRSLQESDISNIYSGKKEV